ncbi:MAG: leucine-rich repeat domain-containing protein [Culicoidibacterales bacterium]
MKLLVKKISRIIIFVNILAFIGTSLALKIPFEGKKILHAENSVTLPAPLSSIFPDKTLVEFIRKKLDKKTVEEIVTAAELEAIVDIEITLFSDKVTNFEGMQFLKNLIKFGVASMNKQSVDLRPLSKLTELKELRLENGNALDLSTISGLTKLKVLTLRDNNIVSLDFLTNMVELTNLYLNRNMINDIGPLANLHNLEELSLNINPLSSLGALADLEKLVEISFRFTSVSDISPLFQIDTLRSVAFTGNSIKNQGQLSGLINITSLSFSFTNITDLSPLSSLVNLTHLDISRNDIGEIGPLASLTALESLLASQNNIVDLDSISQLPNLQILDFSSNFDLQGIPNFVNLSKMKRLNFNDTGLTDKQIRGLYFQPLDELQYLQLGEGNQISTLDELIYAPKLELLEITGNKVRDISFLSKHKGLLFLLMSRNEITSLEPISGLENLTRVDANENRISDLTPLTELIKIERLSLSGNSIVDVSQLEKMRNLKELFLDGNNIFDLSPLANNSGLREVMARDQQIKLETLPFGQYITLENPVINILGQTIVPSSIDLQGRYGENNQIEWIFPHYVPKMGYSFFSEINGLGFKVFFTGSVEQSLSTVDFELTYDVDGVLKQEKFGAFKLLSEPTKPTKPDYRFTGWSTTRGGDGRLWDFKTEIMPFSDLMLYAKWDLDVELSANNFVMTLEEAKNVTIEILLDKASARGATISEGEQVTLLAEHSIEAKVGTYPVRFRTENGVSRTVMATVDDGQTTIDIPRQTAIHGKSFQLTMEEAQTLTLDLINQKAEAKAWNLENGLDIAYTTTHSIEAKVGTYPVTFRTENGVSRTVMATVDDGYNVKYDINGGQGLGPASEKYAFNQRLIEPSPPVNKGYIFLGWNTQKSGNGKQWIFIEDKMPQSDLILYAQWTAKTYSVTFNVDGVETFLDVKYGMKVSRPANPEKQGYQFGGWKIYDDNTQKLMSTLEDKDKLWDFENDIMPDNNIILFVHWINSEQTIPQQEVRLPVTGNNNSGFLQGIILLSLGIIGLGLRKTR